MGHVLIVDATYSHSSVLVPTEVWNENFNGALCGYHPQTHFTLFRATATVEEVAKEVSLDFVPRLGEKERRPLACEPAALFSGISNACRRARILREERDYIFNIAIVIFSDGVRREEALESEWVKSSLGYVRGKLEVSVRFFGLGIKQQRMAFSRLTRDLGISDREADIQAPWSKTPIRMSA